MESTQSKERRIGEEERYLRARKRVKQIQGFYWHLFWYLAITIFILVMVFSSFEDKEGVFQYLNFIEYETTYWNILWFWFPMVVWGIVVLIQGLYVFGFGSNWEERKIRELMNKDNI